MRSPSRDLDVLTRIVACPSVESVERVDAAQLDRLVDLATDHKVTGSLVAALRAAGRDLPEPLARDNDAALVNHLRSMAALNRAARALDEIGTRWVVVKGPVIAARWPHGATERAYHDLDLLVAPDDLREAIRALRAIGFEHRNRNWTGFRQLGVGELPLDDGDVVVDLHWSLLGLAQHRELVHLPTRELLDRSVSTPLGQVAAHTLDDTDAFVHLGVHHALAGARNLSQLMDLHLTARDLDVEDLRNRLAAANATLLVATALDRTERVFGPVDGESLVARLVDDRAWLTVNRALDRWWVSMRPGRSRRFPGALVSAARADRATTARAVLKNVVSATRSRLGASTVESEGGPLDWKVDAGGRAAYEAFVDDAARGRYGR